MYVLCVTFFVTLQSAAPVTDKILHSNSILYSNFEWESGRWRIRRKRVWARERTIARPNTVLLLRIRLLCVCMCECGFWFKTEKRGKFYKRATFCYAWLCAAVLSVCVCVCESVYCCCFILAVPRLKNGNSALPTFSALSIAAARVQVRNWTKLES